MKQQHPTMQQTITTTAIRMTATEIPATAPVERPPADLVPVCTCMGVCVYINLGEGKCLPKLREYYNEDLSINVCTIRV